MAYSESPGLLKLQRSFNLSRCLKRSVQHQIYLAQDMRLDVRRLLIYYNMPMLKTLCSLCRRCRKRQAVPFVSPFPAASWAPGWSVRAMQLALACSWPRCKLYKAV